MTSDRRRGLISLAPALGRGEVEKASRRTSTLAGDVRPEVMPRLAPRSNEGAGKTGCALHPLSRVLIAQKKRAHEHTGPAESIRPSLRNGLTAYGALSLETNSCCLHRRRIDGFANPVELHENLRRAVSPELFIGGFPSGHQRTGCRRPSNFVGIGPFRWHPDEGLVTSSQSAADVAAWLVCQSRSR